MAIGIVDADHALADALAVVGDEEQRRAVAAFELVVGRHVIGGVVGEQRLPFVELPFVEQRRLVVEEILHLGARYHGPRRDRHAGRPPSARSSAARRCAGDARRC